MAVSGAPSVDLDARSPAVVHYGVATVTAAVRITRTVALRSVTDPTLLTPVPGFHPIADYWRVTAALSQHGRTMFQAVYDARRYGGGSAGVTVDGLAFALDKGANIDPDFRPDRPIRASVRAFSVEPKISLVHEPGPQQDKIVITGAVSATLPGERRSVPGHLVIRHLFTFYFDVTGGAAKTVGLGSFGGTSTGTFAAS